MRTGWLAAAMAAYLLLLAPGTATAGLEEAAAALEKGDYARALAELRPLAENGDPLAQHNLGVMYQKGIGVARDAGKAVRWYRRAADAGVASSQYNLGLMYLLGQGVPRDPAEARRWFELAARQGHEKARRRLAKLTAAESAAARPAPAGTGAAAAKAPAMPAAKTASAPAAKVPAAPADAPGPGTAVPPASGGKAGKAVGESGDGRPAPDSAGEAPADGDRRGRYGAWLASYRSPTSASKGWNILRRDYPNLFGRLAPVIRKADLGPNKGVFYRLHAVPMSSLAEAEALCKGYKRLNPNGSCFPVELEK